MADRLFTEINTKTVERYESALESVAMLVKSMSRMPSMQIRPTASQITHPAMAVLFEALDTYDFLFSAYVGYEDGGFFQIVALRNKTEIMRIFGAPPEAAYIVRTISADPSGGLVQHWGFLDSGQQIIGRRNDLDPNYDPAPAPGIFGPEAKPRHFSPAPIFSVRPGCPASPVPKPFPMDPASLAPISPWTGSPFPSPGKKCRPTAPSFSSTTTAGLSPTRKEKPPSPKPVPPCSFPRENPSMIRRSALLSRDTKMESTGQWTVRSK